MLWVRVMPKFRIAKEKEKQWGHYKKAATKRLIFFDKSLSEKNVILNILEFPVPKQGNTLIKRKTAANSF